MFQVLKLLDTGSVLNECKKDIVFDFFIPYYSLSPSILFWKYLGFWYILIAAPYWPGTW